MKCKCGHDRNQHIRKYARCMAIWFIPLKDEKNKPCGCTKFTPAKKKRGKE